MANRKIWNIKKAEWKTQESLAKELNISPTLALLLVNRGYDNYQEALEYLEPNLNTLVSPLRLNNMSEALEKIKKAVKEEKKIIIYGDYDVDGITSTALLTDVFKALGIEVEYYIPDRIDEGYGLNIEALKMLAESGAQLIITVDCGISSKAEVEAGKNLGLDFIITDHHQPPEELPNCLIINPQIEKETSTWKNLSGVGVAFKLAHGLLEDFYDTTNADNILKYLDLAALGTVADIVPLVGENRIIVKYGLEQIAKGKRTGIRALCECANIDYKNINSNSIGYFLAPRLNACGRIGDASLGVKLLLTDCEDEARELAHKLNLENQNRQNIEGKITSQAIEMAELLDLDKTKVIVLTGKDWHQGVIGIVASRLVERFYRPVIILTKQNDLYKGSSRSIPGFHLYQALTECQELLESFGGHSQAAGLSLREENIENFINHINHLASEMLTVEDFIPSLNLDGEINLEEADFNLVEEIAKLEPFGCGNSEPLLVYRRSEVKEYKEVGSNGGHLKLKIKAGKTLWDAIGFNMSSYLELAAAQKPLDIAFTLDKNNWNGKTTLQLVLKDLKACTQPDNSYIKQDFLELLFINGSRYLMDDNDQEIYFKEYLERKNNPSRVIDPFVQDKVVCIDVRGFNDKIGYIKNIIRTGEKSIIYVNSRKAAYYLAADLRRDIPMYKEKIGYYNAGLNTEERQSVEDLFREGKLQFIVTTSAFSIGMGIPDIKNVIFYHMCFSQEEHNYVAGWVQPNIEAKAKIHLLYGSQDRELNQLLLAGTSPNREQLAPFFLLLKKLTEKANPINITNSQLAEWANIYKIVGIQANNIGIWLDILEELGIIKRELQGTTQSIYLPTTQPKVNLEGSTRYQKGMAEKNKFLDYVQLALKNHNIKGVDVNGFKGIY